jgi:tRNA threonylcarbamoyl adenosine modification protein YjeE
MGQTAISIELEDETATLGLGRRLAALVSPGDVITLSGVLGAGKTTLARGLIGGLAERAGLLAEDVPSPSFPVVQVYELGDIALWHFDLYRIERETELDELGLEEALGSAVALIEWPERAAGRLPARRLDVRLEWSAEGRLALLAGTLQSGHVATLQESS